MFKYLKELKDAIKEGIDEGLEEARREEALAEAEPSLEERLQSVSAAEQFGVALCAPYREVYSRCVGSWAGKSAITLYQIELPEEDGSGYAEILERDFDAVDETSSLAAIQLFKAELRQGSDYAKAYQYLEEHGCLNRSVKDAMGLSDSSRFSKKTIDAVLSYHAKLGLGPKGGDAFRIAVIAHLASAAGALGFLSHQQSMDHLQVSAALAKERYTSWQHYADGFIAGQRAWAFQHPIGEKMLVGAIKKLHTKESSPWQTIPWNRY